MLAEYQLSAADCLALERDGCARSLVRFVKEAWHVVEPGQPYVHGWHIDAVAEHLAAITSGEITRLLINVPPGTMKSLLTAVFWPAWEWGPKGKPATRYVATSHAEPLAIRDNLRCRRLIQSQWYQERWGDEVQLTTDQSEKKNFENTATGFRKAMAFNSLTGSRGDRVVIDDPLSVDDAASETKREAVNTTFLESVPTRLNNPATSAIVVIMQRLHQRDVSGIILDQALGYEHLMLPMEFERSRACVTGIGFADPRKTEGELLFPDRFPREVVDRDKRVMGSYASAGQMQQRPAPREGGMFKRAWFDVVDAAPASRRKVRRWDFAATESNGRGDPDWTVGLLLSESAGVYYVEDIVRDRVSPAGVERMLKNTASQDGKQIKVRIPQDPGAAGKSSAAAQIKLLVGYDIRAELETGSKEVRANPVSAQAEAGNIKLVRAPWNDGFLEELCLAKGTRISKIDGDTPIEDVRIGDMVMTRNGERRVLEAQMTSAGAELWEIQTNTGRAIRATSNHPIFVQGCGFTKAAHLKAGDVLLRFTGETLTTCTRTAKRNTSQGSETANSSSCIEQFGKPKSDQLSRGFTSTTGMETHETTPSKTSRPSTLETTSQSTESGKPQRPSTLSPASFAEAGTKQRNPSAAGHVHPLAGTSCSSLSGIKPSTPENAKHVASSFGRSSQQQGFAASSAQTKPSESKSLDQSPVASGADSNSRRYEQTPNYAADAVVVSIRKLPGVHPVFNIEVEADNEYFAEGLLVHNCMFPNAAHDDQMDALSGAFASLLTASNYTLSNVA